MSERKEYTFSLFYREAKQQLGEPVSEDVASLTTWHCGCEYHHNNTDGGILFTCDEHAE